MYVSFNDDIMLLKRMHAWDGLAVITCPPHVVGRGFAPRSGHTKHHHKNGTNCLPDWHTCIRVAVGSIIRLCKWPGSGNVYGDIIKISCDQL